MAPSQTRPVQSHRIGGYLESQWCPSYSSRENSITKEIKWKLKVNSNLANVLKGFICFNGRLNAALPVHVGILFFARGATQSFRHHHRITHSFRAGISK